MQQCGHQLHPHGPRDDRRQAGHQGWFTALLENAHASNNLVNTDHVHSLRRHLLSNKTHRAAFGCHFCCRSLKTCGLLAMQRPLAGKRHKVFSYGHH